MPNILKTTGIQPEPASVVPEEKKDHFNGHALSKFEYDLYHEDLDIALPIVRVKRISLPNKGEKWRISQDNKVIFTLEGSKLTNKEKDFLHTVDGVNFLIGQFKGDNFKSFNALRKELKKNLK